MSMTKKDIADLLVEQMGVNHNQALSMTNNFLNFLILREGFVFSDAS
jgi:nucleoid DNA-binding protein